MKQANIIILNYTAIFALRRQTVFVETQNFLYLFCTYLNNRLKDICDCLFSETCVLRMDL